MAAESAGGRAGGQCTKLTPENSFQRKDATVMLTLVYPPLFVLRTGVDTAIDQFQSDHAFRRHPLHGVEPT